MNMIKKLFLLTLILPGIVKPTYKPTYNWPASQVPQKEASINFRLPKVNWPSLNIDRIKEFLKPEILVGAAVCLGGIAAIYGLYKYFKKSDDSPSQGGSFGTSARMYNRYSGSNQQPQNNPVSRPITNTEDGLNSIQQNSNNNYKIIGQSEYNNITIYQFEASHQKGGATCATEALNNAIQYIQGLDFHDREVFENNLQEWKNIALIVRKTEAVKKELTTILTKKIAHLNSDELDRELYEFLRKIMTDIAFEISYEIVNLLPGQDFSETEGGIANRIRDLIKRKQPSDLLQVLFRSQYNANIEEYLPRELAAFIPAIDNFTITLNARHIKDIFEKQVNLRDQTGGWLEADEIKIIIEKLNEKTLELKDIITCFNNGESLSWFEYTNIFKELWKGDTDCQHIFLCNNANAVNAYEAGGQTRGHWYAIVAIKEYGFKSMRIIDSANTDRTKFEEVKQIINFLES